MSEDKLQAICYQWFHNSYPDLRGLLWAVPNGGSRNVVEAMKLKATGVVAGVHDLHFLYNGQLTTLELKVNNNPMSSKQKNWANTIEHHGANWHLVTTFIQFKEILQNIIIV
ncbi:MAG: hypothetical protein V3V14_08545 [Saprospiraceae bacterium]